MKDFLRQEPLFSLCGLNCGLCTMHLGGHCPGCGGGAGNQSCSLARCSLQHGGVAFCWMCPDYPCDRYQGFDDYDTFLPHRNRQKDIARAQEMGLEAYLTQLRARMAALDTLLTHYNDGRRKTLFATAAYLLGWPALQAVMEQLAAHLEWLDLPAKSRASHAAALLQEAADRQGISLQLKKKPRKRP